MASAFTLLRPLLHCLPPETAHGLGLWALGSGVLAPAKIPPNDALRVKAFGLTFAHPLGMAAGFDKNAVAVNGLLQQGFAFVEAGTVTPKAQPGNPRPRLFRLTEDEAVINRLGFNNRGLERFVANFQKRDRRLGVAGANIGKNKDSIDAVADYVTGLRAVYPHADYVTINISSPNTQGLRDLQQREALDHLLSALTAQRQMSEREHHARVPILLKVAPDLDRPGMEDVAAAVLAHGVDGLIISNTTLSRPSTLRSRHFSETGGLSGKPLFALSTECLKIFYKLTGGNIPLVGVGGIASAHDAYVKIRAGATLVQLYTAVVYQGFGLARDIALGLDLLLRRDGFVNVGQAVGVDVRSNLGQ